MDLNNAKATYRVFNNKVVECILDAHVKFCAKRRSRFVVSAKAKCNPVDQFNEETGKALAYAKAYVVLAKQVARKANLVKNEMAQVYQQSDKSCFDADVDVIASKQLLKTVKETVGAF